MPPLIFTVNAKLYSTSVPAVNPVPLYGKLSFQNIKLITSKNTHLCVSKLISAGYHHKMSKYKIR